MKNIFTLLFLSVLIFMSCSDDSGNFLNHDGENFSAPFLPAGTHIAGAKFESNDLSPFIGRNLEQVQFYMLNVPSNAIVEVYGQGTLDAPGPLLVSEDIGSNMAAQSWNAYILDSPIEITGEELWICITVTHDSNTNTIGCDPGPAVDNGDWIRVGGSATWETFRDYTSEATSINWNIRGVLGE